MLEVGGGRPLMKKKESGGSMKEAIKRRFTVHKPQFTSDMVDAFEKIKSFSRGGYLLKIERVPEKETSNDHAAPESVVVKWRAPIDHPTSDWIGIWPVGGSKVVRKLGRVLQISDEAPVRSHMSQPVVGKCWAFVPKGRKGLITFSGDKLPASEGRYRISYVLDGDPWSEQTIALHGPEFNIVDDKCTPSPRQDLKASAGGTPLSPRSGGMTFSLSYEAPSVIDDEEKQRAWREDWMASVEEVDQARLLEWEAKRLPGQKGGQTLAEVSFQVPQQIRTLRSRNDSSSDSDSEEDEEEREEESNSRRKRQLQRERMQKMKSEGAGLDGWKKNSRGGKRELRQSTSDNERELEVESPQLQSSASFSPVVSIIDTDGKETVVTAATKEKKERRGGSLRRKKSDPPQLVRSLPPSIPVLHLKPTLLSDVFESHTLPSSPTNSHDLLSSARAVAFPEEASPTPADLRDKLKSSKSSKKKTKKGSAIRSSKDKTIRIVGLDDIKPIPATTIASASSSGNDVVVRPAMEPSLSSDDVQRKNSVGSESNGAAAMARPKASVVRVDAAAEELKKRKRTKKQHQHQQTLSTSQQEERTEEDKDAGQREDLFGVKERYQIEMGRVTFSEEFIFYFLIFVLVVFLIFRNALHELRLIILT